MEEQVERFLAGLGEDRGFSQNTVAAYRNDLGQFTGFLREQLSLTSWAELQDTHLTSYVLHLRERLYANSTVARKVAAVKSFSHFLHETGVLRHDPASSLPSPKVDKFLPRAITEEEVATLLAEASRVRTPEGLRDHAMLQTLYATGMRVSELTALDLDDVDLERRQIRCGRKPDRTRWVPLTPEATAAITEYLEVGRPLLSHSSEETSLFLNHRGARLTRQGFWLILKEYAEAARISDITPHTLRHTFAAHALSRGVELRELQRYLGHMSLSTTQVYQQLAAQVVGVASGNGRALVESTLACYDTDGSE